MFKWTFFQVKFFNPKCLVLQEILNKCSHVFNSEYNQKIIYPEHFLLATVSMPQEKRFVLQISCRLGLSRGPSLGVYY